MSITREHAQELLHRAYVLAVTAQAGLNISLGSQLDYGIDVTVSEVAALPSPRVASKRMYLEEGLALKLQLKATINWRQTLTHIHYKCDGDAYNRMIIQNARGISPVVLVVFCQPKLSVDWLEVDEDSMVLKKACYWYYLAGSTTTQTSKVIRIPRAQLFTPVELKGIMNRINSGGTP